MSILPLYSYICKVYHVIGVSILLKKKYCKQIIRIKVEKINELKHEQKPSFKVVDISNCPYGVNFSILICCTMRPCQHVHVLQGESSVTCPAQINASEQKLKMDNT
jgi:hypothetical protein